MRILPYDAVLAMRPSSCDQADGLALAKQELTQLHADGLIVGAMLYGSRVVADALPTSDIDQITVVEARTTAALARIRRATKAVIAGSGLFVENVTYTKAELSSGNHRLHPGILCHLAEQADQYPANVIGEGVLQFVLPWQRDNIKDIADHIDGQLFLLENYFTWVEHDNPHGYLSDLLHVPLRVCRKSLGILQAMGAVPAGTLPDVRKATVARAVREVYSPHDEQLGELFEVVRHYLHDYPAITEMVESGRLTREEYEQLIIATTEVVAPQSFELLRRIRQVFLELASASHVAAHS